MKQLYFIRHGESVGNAEGWYAGRIDTPLTEKGRQQAQAAGRKAKQEGMNFDLIISSPLSRALDTARIVAEEVGYPLDKIQSNPMLIERNYGQMGGKPWQADVDFDNVIDAESSDELLARAKEVIAWLHQIEEDKVLIVCHGSIGRAIRFHLLDEEVHDLEGRIANAEIVQWL